MKFKNKLLVFIYISILVPVIVTVAASFKITEQHVADLQFALLDDTVKYVLSKSQADFEAINALGMAEVEFYKEATKKNVLRSIDNYHAPGESVWVIDTRSYGLIYSTNKDTPAFSLTEKEIEEMAKQQSGRSELTLASSSGQEMRALVAFGVYPNWQWLVVSGVNRTHLHRYIYDAMIFTIASSAVFLFVIFILVYRFSSGFSGALVALQRGAIRLSRNDFGTPITISGSDEFASLARSFNTMAAEIRKTQSHLQATLNAMPDLLFEVDVDGRIFSCHSNRSDLLASPPEVFVGKTMTEILPPEVAKVCIESLQEASVQGLSFGGTYSLALPKGETWFELSVAAMAENDEEPRHYVMLVRDITSRRQALEAQQQLSDRLSMAIRAASVGIWEYDLITHQLIWDKACYGLFGLTPEQAPDPMEVHLSRLHPDDVERVLAEFQRALAGEIEHDIEYRAVWPTGEVRHIHSIGMFHRGSSGSPLRMIGTNRDITEQKEHQRELERIAHFDSLTGLPNRMLLADRLEHAILQAKRSAKGLAVAYLDLDGFKSINDHFGHAVGDRLLETVADRMKQVLREGDTLARIGGDEFVAVLIDLIDVEDSMPMLDRLLTAAGQLMGDADHVFSVSASIGVAFFHQIDAWDADQLLRQADQAMYQAKVAGKNRYHVFDAAEDNSIRGYYESLEEIRLALEREEFVLFYQPKINMCTGKVVGAEALIRWLHPEKGLLAPMAFLPVIEDDPLAIDIGEWVIETALKQMEQWQACGRHIPVSVNVGARQLQQVDFVERLMALLARHGKVNPSKLQLEILETSALGDMTQVSLVVDRCARMGVTFALDDFGTGYSSLTYLKRLHVSVLKMDQSFVHDMLVDPDDLAILKGVISLAKAFNRQVIAEGVETAEHGHELIELGCEIGQGFGIAYPMAENEVLDWMSNWKPEHFEVS